MIESGQYQRSTRGGLPQWFLEQPHVTSGEAFVLDAFYVLSTCRGADGRIPWTAAIQYAAESGFERRDRRWFADLVLNLDRSYASHLEKKAEAEGRRKERKSRVAKLRSESNQTKKRSRK